MDPFLSIVANSFLGRAGILYYKGQAKPEGSYPNRPVGEEKARQSYHSSRKSVLPSDNTHLRPSSAFFVFDEKNKIK